MSGDSSFSAKSPALFVRAKRAIVYGELKLAPVMPSISVS
jgi:hypothetical protein